MADDETEKRVKDCAAGLGATVAKHYNELKETGLAVRTQSRIFYMRNFHNWVKSVAINDFLTRIREKTKNDPLTVLDLCCGKGGDLLKWKKGNIKHLVCADIAAVSVEQCRNRYKEMLDRNSRERRPDDIFSAEFITADCSKVRLRDRYDDPDIRFNLVSCQFSFHYSFESFKQADMMLRNASENLKLGGYFLGTTPDANELVKRLRASPDNSFGNDVYRLTFLTEDKNDLPLFGAKYDFHLEGAVDCPEFLVYFSLLEQMAEKYGMTLVYKMPFGDFFKRQIKLGDGRGLIGRMQGLEPYPAEEGIDLMSKNDGSYAEAQKRLEELNQQAQEEGSAQNIKVGTLTEEEWAVSSLYLVFAFKKTSDNQVPYKPPKPRSIPDTQQSTSTLPPHEKDSQISLGSKRPADNDESEVLTKQSKN